MRLRRRSLDAGGCVAAWLRGGVAAWRRGCGVSAPSDAAAQNLDHVEYMCVCVCVRVCERAGHTPPRARTNAPTHAHTHAHTHHKTGKPVEGMLWLKRCAKKALRLGASRPAPAARAALRAYMPDLPWRECRSKCRAGKRRLPTCTTTAAGAANAFHLLPPFDSCVSLHLRHPLQPAWPPHTSAVPCCTAGA